MTKRLPTLLLAGALTLGAGCKNYLDVNQNPNAPEAVTPNLYLPPFLHWMVTAPLFDGRFMGRYTQQFALVNAQTSVSTWDRMGYDPGSDNGAEQWRDVYWTYGQNLIDMMNKAQVEERWDILGLGYALKAWGWQALTDMHGEIIISQAFNPTKFYYDYDTQEFAYQEIHRLLDSAIVYLQKTDGAVDQAYFARGDRIYLGDRTKWLKYAYGLLARNLNHLSNKASLYKPADVIAAVDKSFASNADDALLSFTNVDPGTADYNFWGQTRNNITNYRQTQFVVGLMNGTQLGTVDPRMTRMLAPSPDGQFRGVDVNLVAFGALTAAQQPNNFFGGAGTTRTSPGRYLFEDKSKMPAMTYAELQFIKAEAAYRAGDKATALAAYRNAISAHIDFVNSRNLEGNQAPTQITLAEKNAFLADPNIVPTSPASLTLTHIMSQKYIALWAWGQNELFLDMRRYHYTDIDPASGKQVYPGFTPPTNLYPDNSGKIAQRIRPRYNSEYVWNSAALKTIGGLSLDYHTKQMWITQP